MEFIFPYKSPLGGITLISDGESLTGLWFEDRRHNALSLSKDCAEAALPVFAQAVQWLDIYFSGRRPDFLPPLHLKASAFRVTVWETLLTIPYGETTTYGAVADTVAMRLGRERMSAQAVGGAVGSNPISLIVPCHRVVGTGGNLTGYGGGLERKLRLLELERADTSGLFFPKNGAVF